MTDQIDKSAEANDLGQLLIDHSPYGTPDSVDYTQIELDGPAQNYLNQPGQQLTAVDLERLRATPQEGVWWYFDGRPRFIAKAMRLAYTYILDGEDQPRTDYFMIGYEGAGW